VNIFKVFLVLAISSLSVSNIFGQFSVKSRSEDASLVKFCGDSLQTKIPTITTGGEIREYLQIYDQVNFGQIPSTFTEPNPTQLWHRVLLNASLKLSNQVRVFGQLNSTFRFFNPNPIVSQVDQNELAIHQLLVETKLGKNSLLRLGKMENFYGNDRLMANREGPNNRNAYVGGLFRRYYPKSSLDVFYLHPMIQKPEFLNDEIAEESITGAYLQNWKIGKTQTLDLYGMYLHSNSREYLYHKGIENRLTTGFRLVKPTGHWQYLFENAFQTGTFNDLTIRSFMSIWEIIYTTNNKLSFAFSGTYVPGDSNPNDGYLETFNTLFAKPPFGQTVALNITNMVNFSPYIKYQIHSKSFIILRNSIVSRASTADGIYTPNMSQLRPIANKMIESSSKKVTDMYVVELNFFPRKTIQTLLEFGYSKAGNYLKDTGPAKDVTYIAWRGAYRF
jgi:hypothetical protein